MPKMTFGKHRDKPLSEIDTDYLMWALDLGNLKPRIKRWIEEELYSRDPIFVQKFEISSATGIVKAGYRLLSKKFHPDTGGDSKEFMSLKAAYDKLMNSLESGKI